MYRSLYELILPSAPRLVYTAQGAEPFPAEARFAQVRFEACVNEKAAFEMALAGAWAAKRTACLFSVAGVYEALDPLMSSAYMGVKGGFVVVCVKEGLLDASPLGPFSKLPVLVADGTAADLSRALAFAFDLSERHEIPCLVQTLPPRGHVNPTEETVQAAGVSRFERNPARWAAIPQFRYELHRALNEKVERIREELETYGGNEQVMRGSSGIITHRAIAAALAEGAGASLLSLGAVFPLPSRTVSAFIDLMEEVRIAEGPYPAIELQVRQKDRIRGGMAGGRIAPPAPGRDGEQMRFGSRVMRDELGPASSINMAHGMATSGTEGEIIAVTDEEAFLHSGLPAFVNTLYNGSAFLLVVRAKARAGEIEAILGGFGFSRCFRIGTAREIEGYIGTGRLTVLLCEGDL